MRARASFATLCRTCGSKIQHYDEKIRGEKSIIRSYVVRVLIKNCKASKESCKQQAPHHPSRKSAWHGSAEGKKEKDQVFFFAFPSAAQHEEARPKYVIVVDIPFFFFPPFRSVACFGSCCDPASRVEGLCNAAQLCPRTARAHH